MTLLKFQGDRSPSVQRVLPNTAEFYNVINHMNGSANGEDSYDAALYAIFLEMPERHMAEQLTRLDTVH